MSGWKDQLGDTLYEERYPNAPGWQSGSETSRAAADAIRPHYNKQQQKIIDWLKEQGERGATYNEICDGTKLSTPSVCGRMVELVSAGSVIKSDQTRPTASGRKAHVYVHPDFTKAKP